VNFIAGCPGTRVVTARKAAITIKPHGGFVAIYK
jgi:hypothetical protein